MIAAYQDLNGYVGEREPPRDREAEADDECALAFAAAERLADLLDRRAGTSGDKPDALASITERLLAIHEEARALLGDKPRVVRNKAGDVLGYVWSAAR